MLVSLFATVISAALEILDNGRVTRFVCENSKREFFRVKESRRQADEKGSEKGGPVVYYDIMGEFCFCYFYARQCLSERGSSYLCKHVLAAKLAVALSEAFPEKLTIKQVEEQDFAPLLLSSRQHLERFDDKK